VRPGVRPERVLFAGRGVGVVADQRGRGFCLYLGAGRCRSTNYCCPVTDAGIARRAQVFITRVRRRPSHGSPVSPPDVRRAAVRTDLHESDSPAGSSTESSQGSVRQCPSRTCEGIYSSICTSCTGRPAAAGRIFRTCGGSLVSRTSGISLHPDIGRTPSSLICHGLRLPVRQTALAPVVLRGATNRCPPRTPTYTGASSHRRTLARVERHRLVRRRDLMVRRTHRW